MRSTRGPSALGDFRRLFVGQGVAFVGFQLTAVAVPVQMFAVTGSSFWVGLVGLAALSRWSSSACTAGRSPTRWTAAGSTCWSSRRVGRDRWPCSPRPCCG